MSWSLPATLTVRMPQMVGGEEAGPRSLSSALDAEDMGSNPGGPLSSQAALGKSLSGEPGWEVGAGLQTGTGS